VAIAFCADDERGLLRDIQKLTRQILPTWDRRNDKRLGEITAATTSGPAAEQALPQAKAKPAGNGPNRAKAHHRPRGHGGGAPKGPGQSAGGQGRGGQPRNGQARNGQARDGQAKGGSRPQGGGGAKPQRSGWSPLQA
jgi:ATP-dependent RNA helicase RhlE